MSTRPAAILGFAFYVLGTGCVALGVAQLGIFAGNLHAIALAPLPSWALLLGQGMVLVGLAIAWRATNGALRRLLGVAATLWLTLLVFEMQQGRFTDALSSHASDASASRALFAPTTASLVGRAIVLVVVAVAAHASGRALPSRSRTWATWATTLGAVLVFADAWAGAWPVVTRPSFGHTASRLLSTTPTMLTAGAGLLLAAGGLYATGRAILRRAEGAGEEEREREEEGEGEEGGVEPAAPRGFSLYREGVTAAAGLALAHAVAVAVSTHVGLSMHDVSDTATLGGELLAWSAIVVALRRMRPSTKRALGFAVAVLVAVGVEVLLRYTVWSHGLLSPSRVAAFASSVLPFVAGIRVLLTLRALRAAATTVRLRLGANLLAGSLVASFFAPDLSGVTLSVLVQAIAVVLGALALYVMISAADPRRIENQPAT